MKPRSGGRVSLIPMYRSALGDALLPGDSLAARQIRSRFSEMLVKHLAAGGASDLVALGAALAAFTPADILAESDADAYGWKARRLKEWEDEQKPQLFAALEAFLLDGGHERRVEVQRVFVHGLLDAGVRIEGAAALADLIAYAGDWHGTFLHVAEQGREQGVRFHGESVDVASLNRARGRPDSLRCKRNRSPRTSSPIPRPRKRLAVPSCDSRLSARVERNPLRKGVARAVTAQRP